VCRRLTGNDADAQDAAQESLIAIARGIGRFDGRSRFTTWAYRVTTNACLDELRRRKRRPPVAREEDAVEDVAAGGVDLDSTVTDRLAIDDALAELPREFRVAVVLRDVCRLDYAEIAEVLGIPPGTVRSRISRGRAALARTLVGNPAPTDERPTH
jgi:RNA polymerase sigma-70 factor (ECF subfamily)